MSKMWGLTSGFSQYYYYARQAWGAKVILCLCATFERFIVIWTILDYSLDIQNYGCNGELLSDHGVVGRNRNSSSGSHGKCVSSIATSCQVPALFQMGRRWVCWSEFERLFHISAFLANTRWRWRWKCTTWKWRTNLRALAFLCLVCWRCGRYAKWLSAVSYTYWHGYACVFLMCIWRTIVRHFSN